MQEHSYFQFNITEYVKLKETWEVHNMTEYRNGLTTKRYNSVDLSLTQYIMSKISIYGNNRTLIKTLRFVNTV